MSRRTRERRLEAEERWPNLRQFLGCYFHEDCFLQFGTVEAALEQAISDWTLEGRQLVLREWRDWNMAEGWRNNVDASLADGFGIALVFDDDEQARGFMNRVYDRLIESVRREVSRRWKKL